MFDHERLQVYGNALERQSGRQSEDKVRSYSIHPHEEIPLGFPAECVPARISSLHHAQKMSKLEAVDVSSAVEPRRLVWRGFAFNFSGARNISEFVPGGGTHALYVRRDARRYSKQILGRAGPFPI
jgi:hypothetical protein